MCLCDILDSPNHCAECTKELLKMDSYNFSPPLPIDFEETCSDCGRELENGKNTICEYCNKRYQNEAMIEAQMLNDIPYSDEDALSYQG